METIISVLTSVVLALIAIGFALGFFRGWAKSLSRFATILGSLLIAIFLSPVISKKLISKFVQGTTFVGFGLEINVEGSVSNLLGDANIATDLLSSTQTTTDLAIAIINVVMNIVAFMLIFISLYLVSLLVFWIVSITLGVKRRKKGEQIEKTASYWWLRVLGGGIGIVSSIATCFVLLTPMFGAMNICDKFLTEETSSKTASAAGFSNYSGSKIFYTEDESIGEVEGYILDYSEIKEFYDGSFIGGFFKYTGVEKLGESTFNHLTDVKSNGLEVNVTNEVVSLIRTYNIYKKHFVTNEFDLANNESLDGILEIYEIANESEIVKNYIEEFIPKFCERWLADEKFLGVAKPVSGEFEPFMDEVLEVFKTTNTTRIKNNITTLVNAIKTANDHGIIQSVRENKDLIEILSNDPSFVKDEIVVLSATNELKTAMPNMLHEFVVIAYNKIVAGDASFEKTDLTNQQIDAINWKTEGQHLQDITTNILTIYNTTKETSDAEVMTDLLINVGQIIDSARASATISKPFKVFIEEFIASDNINLSADVKQTIKTTISNNWDDENYSYAVTFAAIQETAKIAQSIINGNGSIDINTLSGVLSDIISSDTAKDTINQIIDSEIVSDMLGDGDVSNSLTDILDTLVNNTETSEDLNKALESGQEIVNLISSANSDDGLKLEGTTEAEKKETATNIIENIASSDVVMDLLESSSNDANSSIGSILSNVGGDSSILKDAVSDANISDEYKNILNNLFA